MIEYFVEALPLVRIARLYAWSSDQNQTCELDAAVTVLDDNPEDAPILTITVVDVRAAALIAIAGKARKDTLDAGHVTVSVPLRLAQDHVLGTAAWSVRRRDSHVEVVMKFLEKTKTSGVPPHVVDDSDDIEALQHTPNLACRKCESALVEHVRGVRALPSSPLWSEDALTWHCAGCCGDAGLHTIEEAGTAMAPAAGEVLVGPSVCVTRLEDANVAVTPKKDGEDDAVVPCACRTCGTVVGVTLPSTGCASLFKHRIADADGRMQRHTALTALAADVAAAHRTRGTCQFVVVQLGDFDMHPRVHLTVLGQAWVNADLHPCLRVSFKVEEGRHEEQTASDAGTDVVLLRLPSAAEFDDIMRALEASSSALPVPLRTFMGARVAYVPLSAKDAQL